MIYLSLKHSITNKFYVKIQLILHALENYNPPPLSLPITAFLAQKCCRSFLWAHTIWYTLKKRIEIKLICNYFCFQIMHDNGEIGSYHPTTILGSKKFQIPCYLPVQKYGHSKMQTHVLSVL